MYTPESQSSLYKSKGERYTIDTLEESVFFHHVFVDISVSQKFSQRAPLMYISYICVKVLSQNGFYLCFSDNFGLIQQAKMKAWG